MELREYGLSQIVGSSLVIYEAMVDEFRRLLRRELKQAQSPAEILVLARRAIEAFEPLLAQTITDAEVAAWILAASGVTEDIPLEIADQLSGRWPWELAGVEQPKRLPSRRASPRRVVSGILLQEPDPEPIIRFPALDASRADLLERQIVTRLQFDLMAAESKARAFTVAHVATTEALTTVRDAVIEAIQEGGTLRDFRHAAQAVIAESSLSRPHVETVFRVNVQAGYAIGQMAITENPVLRPVFPYARYDAIHDGRVRPDHLALETHGLDGTNIYRSDDPIWRIITPPWNFNCRCAKTFLTIRQAAQKGVQEAILWLETGNPPVSPQYVEMIAPPASGFTGPGVRLVSLAA